MEFIDLKRQYNLIKEEINAAINRVLSSSRFILGEEVEKLEKELEKLTGARYAVTCSSGTDALLLSLMAIDIKEGDEVIVPAFTFFATAETVALLKAKPVFVDIDEKTYNIDPEQIESKITSKTKAIIAVSLFGQCPDFDRIMDIASRYNIKVIEDAAQSLGAKYKGRNSCNIAHISTTSFFPAKPLGCYGDGGAVFTNDEHIYNRIKALRNHGQIRRYEHKYIGLNARLDAIQAAVLNVKLKIFPEEIKKRQTIASIYNELLKGIGIDPPFIAPYNLSVYAQYSIRVKNRDKLIQFLNSEGIPTAIHYPIPLPYQEAFSYLGYKWGDFPVSDKVSKEILSLPFHPYMEYEEQQKVVNAISNGLNLS